MNEVMRRRITEKTMIQVVFSPLLEVKWLETRVMKSYRAVGLMF